MQLYAAKVVAARLCARPGELAAIIGAIRAEERAALKALKDRAVVNTWERRKRFQRAAQRLVPPVTQRPGDLRKRKSQKGFQKG